MVFSFHRDSLLVEISWEFHAHEEPNGRERDDDESEAHECEELLIETDLPRSCSDIHNNEADSTDSEQETRC